MVELGMSKQPFDNSTYENLFTHLIIDRSDSSCAAEVGDLGLNVSIHDTFMQNLSDKIKLAENTLMAAENNKNVGCHTGKKVCLRKKSN